MRNLLFQDLCVRIPYGVKCVLTTPPPKWFVEAYSVDFETEKVFTLNHNLLEYVFINIEHVKPYLRSLSSITEDELKEVNEKFVNIGYFFKQNPPYDYGLMCQHSDADCIIITEFTDVYKWLIAHHFDVNDLIGKGIAIEAPEGIYKIK